MKSKKIKIVLCTMFMITIINIVFIKTHMIENDFNNFLNNKDIKVTLNQNFDAFSTEYLKQDGKSMYKNNYTDYDALFNDSDLIAIVNPLTYHQANKTVLTTVAIQKVIKGNYNKNTNIKIYEPYYFYTNFYMTDFYYSPMRKTNSYIVFLKKESILGDNIYNFTSNMYAKFPFKNELNIFYADTTSTITQANLSNIDLVIFPEVNYMEKEIREKKCLEDESFCYIDTSDKTQVDLYNSYKSNYMKIFNQLKRYLIE